MLEYLLFVGGLVANLSGLRCSSGKGGCALVNVTLFRVGCKYLVRVSRNVSADGTVKFRTGLN